MEDLWNLFGSFQFIIQNEMSCLNNETTVTNELQSDCGSKAITDVSST